MDTASELISNRVEELDDWHGRRLHKDDEINESALKALFREAVAVNVERKK